VGTPRAGIETLACRWPGKQNLPATVMVQFDKEASQARDYWVAKNTTHRAARPDPSRRKERLLRMTVKGPRKNRIRRNVVST